MARVRGHALIAEGWGHVTPTMRTRARDDAGMGKCECGAVSVKLDTIAARKIWHRAHKQEVTGA